MGCCRSFWDTLRIGFVLAFDPLKRLKSCCFPNSKKSVKGEVILITGAGQGLGKELALVLAEMGPALVLWDVMEDSVNAVAEQIRRSGRVAHAYKVDVTNPQEVIDTAARVKQEVGDVTMVINNAGVFSGHPLTELSERDIRRCFEVNAMAHFWILQQFLPRMIEKDSGHVVSIASVAGHIGAANMCDYSASKFAAVGFMDSLYYELQYAKKKNIKLTTVNPVFITTGLISNIRTRFNSLIPLLSPRETAEVIIKGVLREESEIFIPPKISFFLCCFRLFTRKTRTKLVHDYLHYGYDPVSKVQPYSNPVEVV